MRSHCDPLYSEDLSHDRRFGGLTVRNPFFGGLTFPD
jgi:predicted nucleic acid-binding protein